MPRAVIVSVGDLSLQPLKAFLVNNTITCVEYDISKQGDQAQELFLSEILAGIDKKCDCVFISGAEWQQIIQDTAVESFFFVYSLPDTYLVQKTKDLDIDSLERNTINWKQHASSYLHAKEKNTHLTLVSLDDILSNIHSFLKEVFGKEAPNTPKLIETDVETELLTIGVKASLVDKDDLYELYDELLSHSQLFGNFCVHLSPDVQVFKNEAFSLIEIVTAYREKSSEAAQLKIELAEMTASSEKALKELTSKLQVTENARKKSADLARENLLALEAELKSDFAKNKEMLDEKVRQAEKEKEVLAQELVKFKANAAEEQKQAELSIFQLQEELEATFSELGRTKANEKQYKQDIAFKDEELKAKLSKSDEDLKQAAFDILQLQGKLESSLSELEKAKKAEKKHKQEILAKKATLESELAKNNNDWGNKVKLLKSEKEKLLKEFKSVEQQRTEEAKQAELQIFQVQEELEATFLELNGLENKIETLTGSKDFETFINTIKNEKLLLEEQISLLEKNLAQHQTEQSETKVNEVKEELELATLQIIQLQEELEFYYLQALEGAKLKGTEMKKSIIGKSFDSVSLGSLNIVGQYVEDDYRDLHLVLENANFPHCGIVDTLNVKLVNVSGKTGIEFRTEGNADNLFNIHDDCKDEYGAYLRYFPDAPEFLSAQQEKIKQRLSASERLLALCTLNCIQKSLIEGCITNDADVDDTIVKNWKLSLADLEFRKYYPIDWLSFDSVTIKECFAMDGYEHLWLQFNNILAGDVLRSKMDVKLCAKNLTEKGDEFFALFFLEFRVNSDGSEPLYAWPPETSDEYGPKLEIGLLDDLDSLTLAKEDMRLISLIRDNIKSILVKCDTSLATLKHSINAWCNAVENSLEITNEAEPVDASVENKDVAFEPAIEQLSVEEVVDLDGYQHIVFATEDSSLKVKLRAENINNDTFDAEVYLELRDGTQEVIYNATEYFEVDDYGPRVKIPAETLEQLSADADYNGEFQWALACYNALIPSIESSDKVDDLLKIMWAKVLERKKQK